ncbi:MAG: hypothetical protein R2795_20745 [Saprospiraceae bacterium]
MDWGRGFDRSAQVPLDEINFSNLETISNAAIQKGEAFPFQFSTLNPVQQRYFYGFQYENSGS